MTVICWDGKTLAADRMCADEWTKRAVIKIRRVRGGEALAGAAGDSDRCRALLKWFDGGGEFPTHLRTNDNTNATLLVIWRDGSAHLYLREPEPIELLPGGQQAIGSGAEAALAAMHCGKSAVQAVGIAGMFCRGVGMGADALEFD